MFDWAATKLLTAVDIDPKRSHQHELGGFGSLHQHLRGRGWDFGAEQSGEFAATWIFLKDDAEPLLIHTSVTFYDSRFNATDRGPEWRIYYKASDTQPLTALASPGDVLTVALDEDRHTINLFVTAPSTRWAKTLHTVFPNASHPGARLLEFDTSTPPEGQDRFALLIEELGLIPRQRPLDVDWLEERLGGQLADAQFPSTKRMAELAWLRDEPENDEPDALLLSWMNTETRLFYAIEAAQALPRFQEDCESTDDYLTLAKSLLQRRVSRRGRSFELHLDRLFSDLGLQFETQVQTEPGSKVDFLFPGIVQYLDASFPLDDLVHMNAKTTVRERWMQIRNEAKRLTTRHLGTVDSSLSPPTLTNIKAAGIRVVIPSAILSTYPRGSSLWSVSEFADFVRSTQRS